MAESLPAGSERTGSVGEPLTDYAQGGPCENSARKWGYLDDTQSVDCDCGEPQAMAHLLSCRLLLDEACTSDDLATVTERALENCPSNFSNVPLNFDEQGSKLTLAPSPEASGNRGG